MTTFVVTDDVIEPIQLVVSVACARDTVLIIEILYGESTVLITVQSEVTIVATFAVRKVTVTVIVIGVIPIKLLQVVNKF